MSVALIDQLTAARRRAFVGREAMLAGFEQLLTGDGGVLYVHGPGGVGKTSLLRQFAWHAERAGWPVVWRDGRDAAALGDGPNSPTASLALRPLRPGTRLLLVVDTAEALGPLDSWLRDDLIARLPAGSVLVAAGREPPPLSWRVDPGWRRAAGTLALTNLGPDDATQLLRAHGVPQQEHAEALRFTRGHPLALALVADVYAANGSSAAGGVRDLTTAPQVVTALLAGLLDAMPSGLHRAALEACAIVRVTTEPLLAALLGLPDARELFDWLRDRSIVDYGRRGLFPHDLARDALAADLRWRDPQRRAELHRRAGRFYQNLLADADPTAQHELLCDFAFLHRESPVLGQFLAALSPDAGPSGELSVTAARPDDHTAFEALVRRHEGPESARLAAHWLARLPESAYVVRDRAGALAGVSMLLALDRVAPAERGVDPAVDRALEHLARAAPLGSGETATLVRFWLDAADYQSMGPVTTRLTMHMVRHYLTTPRLAYSLLPCADPHAWAATCAYADLRRIEAADFAVGGRAYGVFGHDWRAMPPGAWLDLMARRETADEPLDVVAEPPVGAPARLGSDGFAVAVRAALPDLDRPDRLADSALVSCALVTGPDDDPLSAGRRLQEVLRSAVATLADSPRDRRAYRALHHTYVQPAGTQQAAADLLRLPMSTFRRHLAAGISRLTEILWARELAAR